jgi:hypothetical protein
MNKNPKPIPFLNNILTIILAMFFIGIACASCATAPNVRITTRPEKVILSNDIIARNMKPNGRIWAHNVILPFGTYTYNAESGGLVFYKLEKGAITTKWTEGPNQSKPRERPGGIFLQKSKGIWRIYTIGPKEDLSQDGMPDIGLMFAKKIDDGYLNELGFLGKTDESNQMVPMPAHSVFVTAEDVTGITFVGSVPFGTP